VKSISTSEATGNLLVKDTVVVIERLQIPYKRQVYQLVSDSVMCQTNDIGNGLHEEGSKKMFLKFVS